MLKKLLLIVALVAVGAVSYGVVRAYFSSKTPATSNATFQAGTIDINIEKHDGYNEVPFSMQNWMPGQTQMVVFDIRNTSTVPVTLSGIVNGTWGAALGDQLVHVTGAWYWDDSAWAPLAADTHGTFTYADYASPAVLKDVPANGGVVTMRMEATFDPAAGNEFQGETYTAEIQVTATQVIP